MRTHAYSAQCTHAQSMHALSTHAHDSTAGPGLYCTVGISVTLCTAEFCCTRAHAHSDHVQARSERAVQAVCTAHALARQHYGCVCGGEGQPALHSRGHARACALAYASDALIVCAQLGGWIGIDPEDDIGGPDFFKAANLQHVLSSKEIIMVASSRLVQTFPCQ